MKALIIWAGIAILSTIPLWAQQADSSPSQNAPDVAAMQQQIRDLQDRLISLEGQVRMLEERSTCAGPASRGGGHARQSRLQQRRPRKLQWLPLPRRPNRRRLLAAPAVPPPKR